MAKPKQETPPVADMFAELTIESDAPPTSGPESAGQQHLGGKTQELAPEEEVADVTGAKAPKKRAKAREVPEKAPEITDLSEGTAPPQAKEFGEMEFQTITLNPNNLRFIPGPKRNRLSVLKNWCQNNLAAGYKPLPNGLTWMFELEEDAQKFNKAWNSRVAEKRDEDAVDGAFYA